MQINSKFFIGQRNSDKAITTNLLTENKNKTTYKEVDAEYRHLNRILRICRKRNDTIEEKNKALTNVYKILGFEEYDISIRLYPTEDDETIRLKNENKAKEVMLKNTLNKVIDFFSEFNFSPSFRFVNSLAFVTNQVEYTKNYFLVQDHPYANEISDKVMSPEFKSICSAFKKANPSSEVNTRLKLFFGEPGSGKTTKAVKMSDKCVVCSSDMLPTDLMQNFAFSDGKAEFQKSDLWIAMEEGQTIVLDEINMLPFESLRFLQGITDGKSSFDFKGFTIKIKDGFNIIGTMNLNVNGQSIPLPSPLVDRCSDIKEFKLDANSLYNALI